MCIASTKCSHLLKHFTTGGQNHKVALSDELDSSKNCGSESWNVPIFLLDLLVSTFSNLPPYIHFFVSHFMSFQIKLDDRVLRTDQGLLIRSLTQSDTGTYHCQAVEHGFIQPLLRLNLQVIPTQKLGDILPGLPSAGGSVGHSAKHRLWYRDFLSLLDHPDLNSVEEFCDRVWKKERKQKRVKTPNSNGQGKPDSTGGSNSALRPKALAPNAQKQQASPPQSRPWLQAGAPTVEGPARSQSTQKGQPNLGMLSGQTPKNNQKTQNSQKGQGGLAGSQVVGGSRASSQHTAKWRRMQENKKGRNRRTHELQRPPRSV